MVLEHPGAAFLRSTGFRDLQAFEIYSLSRSTGFRLAEAFAIDLRAPGFQ